MNLGIAEFFADVANHLLPYFTALSIIGGVTMALLQTVKDLLPVRRWFQRLYIKRWLREGAAEAATDFGNGGISADAAEAELLTLAVDADNNAFYDLQIEQLCGQYTAAIQMVLEYPSRYVTLLEVTASKAASQDVQLVLAGPDVPPTQQFLDARNRVTFQSQRAIDALQITAGFRWRWILQIASISVSALLAGIAMQYSPLGMKTSVVSVLFSALLAGFLAPVAKDLLAVLDKARGQ